MIGMTTSNVVPKMELRAIHYSKITEKHTLMFKHSGGEINIVFDRDGEFGLGKFMIAVVHSYQEGLEHFAEEMRKP